MDLRRLAYLSQMWRSKGEFIATISGYFLSFQGDAMAGDFAGKKGGCPTFANIRFPFNEIRVKLCVLRGVFVRLTGTLICSWPTA
jgi:hypothetical protein